jgi:hypothetical protein
LLRAAGVALGITTIYLFWLLDPLISTMHDAVYHWDGSWAELFVVPLVDFCIFWLILTLLLYFARGKMRIAAWCVILSFTPWVELSNWEYLSHGLVPVGVSIFALCLGLAVFPILLALWRSKFEEKFGQVESVATVLFIASAFCGVLILSRYVWLGWEARSLDVALPLHDATLNKPTQPGRPRVIWILFDELSYQQVYERRLPGLELPAFDALASESTVFTHAVPAGAMTEMVLPALLSGEPIDDIRPLANGRDIRTHNSKTNVWRQFDEHNTVFQDALNLNYSTAIAGWYNPYCRLLPDVLDHCFWTSSTSANNTMSPQASWRSNLVQPWIHFFRFGLGYRIGMWFTNFREVSDINSQEHISDYLSLAQAADQLIDNRSVEFTLIHMPIPHPGGIYDRRSGKFAIRNSDYLDNVALADKFLSHVRSKLEKSGEWDSSTIVIMADHSWRTGFMWRNKPEWSHEDEIASRGGQFDDRPFYLVKLPEQRTGARIDTPFAATNTRRLLDALLSQKIRSKEDLSAWAMQSGH